MTFMGDPLGFRLNLVRQEFRAPASVRTLWVVRSGISRNCRTPRSRLEKSFDLVAFGGSFHRQRMVRSPAFAQDPPSLGQILRKHVRKFGPSPLLKGHQSGEFASWRNGRGFSQEKESHESGFRCSLGNSRRSVSDTRIV
jgi:hypothetical protein